MSAAERPIVFAITGASGAPYAVRLLEELVRAERKVQLIVSSHGLRLLRTETDVASVEGLRAHIGEQ
ncbi:MAG TPA: flavoprotein, partial [Gemmatimonadaceae bacterium]|nr:flavoprotein [Gemmatimonadaceae bacterium]